MPHVIWDWNGTLFDDLAIVVASVNASLTQLGAPPIDEGGYRDHFTRPVHVFYEHLLGHEVEDELMARIDETFHNAYFEMIDLAAPAPDAEKAVQRVAETGATQSIASMLRHEWLVPLVRRLGFDEGMIAVDGHRGGVGETKAQHLQAHVELIRSRLPELSGEVTVVGDITDDAAAAVAAGVACVLYDGGSQHLSTLMETGYPVAATLYDAAGLAVG